MQDPREEFENNFTKVPAVLLGIEGRPNLCLHCGKEWNDPQHWCEEVEKAKCAAVLKYEGRHKKRPHQPLHTTALVVRRKRQRQARKANR